MKMTKYLTFILLTTVAIFIANGFAEDSPKSIKVDGTVNDLKFSPNGKYLAIASSEGLWIYDTGGDAEPTVLIGHEGQVFALAWSDSQMIASGGEDKTVRLWNVETSKILKNFKEHKGRVNVLAISPDGKMLASSSRYKIDFSKLSDKPRKSLLDEPIKFPSDPDELKKYLDESNKKWDEEMAEIEKLLDGDTIHLWNTNSVKPLKTLNISGTALVFTSDKTLAIASDDSWSNDSSEFLLHDVDTGINKPYRNRINISVGEEKDIYISNNGAQIRKYTKISAVVFSFDGTRLAKARVLVIESGGSNTYQNIKVKVIDTVNGHPIYINIKDAECPVTTMAFSPNCSHLATGSADKAIQLIDIKKGKPIGTLNKHTNEVTALAFSPNGTLASGSKNGTILIWKDPISK